MREKRFEFLVRTGAEKTCKLPFLFRCVFVCAAGLVVVPCANGDTVFLGPTRYQLSTIDVPEASSTIAGDINDGGNVVGGFGLGGSGHGFVYDGIEYETLDVPDATSTLALGTNNIGHVVGSYADETVLGGQLGFRYKEGAFTTIKVPGARLTVAGGINDAGLIVGTYGSANLSLGQHGFLFDGDNYTTIDFPGADFTTLGGINNAGHMVGFFRVGDLLSCTFGQIGRWPTLSGHHGRRPICPKV